MILFLAGCVPDDYDGTGWPPDGQETGVDTSEPDDTDEPEDTDDTEEPEGPAIVGSWVSEGGDLSELFGGEPFNYQRISAYFKANGSCGSTIVDADGESATTSGTCDFDDSTNPGTITIQQTSPYQATAVGIWKVAGDALTYEVVQTVPDYGYTPPTPSSGFGTTSGPNLDPGVNIQTYRRQP